ncbi:MAG: helix-turn-helix domain-containing protein [Coriobacteriales bacterium]|nr:helix-turn-helix domain-containing protein [Coriobacteriales bacterium]
MGDYGEQLLEEIAALNGLSCGISSTYDRVVRTRAAYLQALRALRDYDEQHGGDLMDTQYCYLQVAGPTTRAAQMLTLHKNTLLYRLNRIRQILGINLASGEDLFQPQMSFRIMLYLGLFRPRLVMAREQLRG